MPTLSTAAAFGLLTAAGTPSPAGLEQGAAATSTDVPQLTARLLQAPQEAPPSPDAEAPTDGGGESPATSDSSNAADEATDTAAAPVSAAAAGPVDAAETKTPEADNASTVTGESPAEANPADTAEDGTPEDDNATAVTRETPETALSAGDPAPPSEAAASTGGLAMDDAPATQDQPKWIRRHRPERQTLEVGVFGGVLFPASDLELFATDFDRPQQGFYPYKRFAPEAGVRIGYAPLRALGFEVEGTYALGALNNDLDAHIWTARGHVVARLPRWRITPFLLAGGGVAGVASQPYAVGRDVDPMLDFGGGVAMHLSRSWLVRLDIRDVLTPSQGNNGGATHSPELLLGLSWTRRPKPQTRPAPMPVVHDPPPPKHALDTDGDSYADDVDACPTEPGGAPDGCPDLDPDDDGILVSDDACPRQAGQPPDGCPPGDRDGDGLLDPTDACPDEAETYNEFEDDDGCPDELPAELGAFSGTLEGVQFQIDRARLRESSKRKLDAVAATLLKYPSTHVEISGHTDSTGSPEHNHQLSQERADAVKAYLVEQGVAAERVQTRGAGPDEPIDTNQTREGRAQNRRIEFRLVE